MLEKVGHCEKSRMFSGYGQCKAGTSAISSYAEVGDGS